MHQRRSRIIRLPSCLHTLDNPTVFDHHSQVVSADLSEVLFVYLVQYIHLAMISKHEMCSKQFRTKLTSFSLVVDSLLML